MCIRDSILTRAAIVARTDTITVDLLSLPNQLATVDEEAEGPKNNLPLRLVSLDNIEHEHIEAILKYTHWHKGKACEILGISRPALDRKIKKYGLE